MLSHRTQAHYQVVKSPPPKPKLVNKLACPSPEKKAQLPTKNIMHAALSFS